MNKGHEKIFNKSQGKMKKILEKSGNFVRVKKWEPWTDPFENTRKKITGFIDWTHLPSVWELQDFTLWTPCYNCSL